MELKVSPLKNLNSKIVIFAALLLCCFVAVDVSDVGADYRDSAHC